MKFLKLKITKEVNLSPKYSLYLEINSRFLITVIVIAIAIVTYLLGG